MGASCQSLRKRPDGLGTECVVREIEVRQEELGVTRLANTQRSCQLCNEDGTVLVCHANVAKEQAALQPSALCKSPCQVGQCAWPCARALRPNARYGLLVQEVPALTINGSTFCGAHGEPDATRKVQIPQSGMPLASRGVIGGGRGRKQFANGARRELGIARKAAMEGMVGPIEGTRGHKRGGASEPAP